MNRKAFFLTIFAFVSLMSANSINANPSNLSNLDQETSAEPVAADRIAVVRQFLEAIEAKDQETIDRLLSENVVLEQPFSQLQPGGIRVEGKQAANAFFDRIFQQYSQIRFVDVVIRQSQFDNAVILEGQGDFRVASNQSPYRNQYIGVLEVVDGQIVLIREYFNPLIEPETSA